MSEVESVMNDAVAALDDDDEGVARSAPDRVRRVFGSTPRTHEELTRLAIRDLP